MSNLFIETVSVNLTKGHRINDPEFVETRFDTKAALYRSLIKEYGGHVRKMYTELGGNKTVQIGWIFTKRERYVDVSLPRSIKRLSKRELDEYTFLCETWVSIHTKKPEIITKYFYAF